MKKTTSLISPGIGKDVQISNWNKVSQSKKATAVISTVAVYHKNPVYRRMQYVEITEMSTCTLNKINTMPEQQNKSIPD